MAAELPVDWQLQCSDVIQRNTQLLHSGLWSDCTFLVGSTQICVSAHRLLLAMASPVFEAMLYGPLAERPKHIVIPDIEPEAFQVLIEYMYTNDIKISSCNVAYGVHYGAQKYMLPHLLTVCRMYLMSCSPVDAGLTYEFAQSVEDYELAENCLTLIKQSTLGFLNSPSFVHLHIHTVAEVFSLEPLNIDSELDLCDAVKRYAEANYTSSASNAMNDDKKAFETAENISDQTIPTNDGEASGNGQVASLESRKSNTNQAAAGSIVQEDDILDQTPLAKRKKIDQSAYSPKHQIRKAIKHIRFLTLHHQTFAEYDFTSLLTGPDILAISLNLMSKDTPVQMPTGFSTSVVPRKKVDTGLNPNTDSRSNVFRTLVKNVSKLEQKSFYEKFTLCNLPCKLKMKVKENESNVKQVSLHFYCNCGERDAWSYQLEVEFRLVSQRASAKAFCKKTVRKFSNFEEDGVTNWGYGRFIDYATLLDPTNGYVEHDTVILEVHIKKKKPECG